MTWTPIGNIKGPPADLSGDIELDDGVWNAGQLRGGVITHATGLVVKQAYTQTANPVDRWVGSPVLVDWQATINNASPQTQTGLYGPRGAFELEGYVRYGVNQDIFHFMPIGFAHILKTGNVAGQARTLVPSWGFMDAELYVADGAVCTLGRNDYAKGGASFVDSQTFLTANAGAWDGVTNDYEIISFLSGAFALGNSTMARRVAFDVKDFNDQGALTALQLAQAIRDSTAIGLPGTDVAVGSVREQIGFRVPRLTAATTSNIGILCQSPIRLWTDTQTFTAAIPRPFLMNGAFTLNFAGATIDALIDLSPTLTFQQAASPFGAASAVKFSPTIQNHSAFGSGTTVWPLNAAFVALPQYRANAQANVAAGILRAFFASTTLAGVSGGTLQVTDLDDFVSSAALSAGAAVGTRRGFRMLESGVAGGSVTLQVGVEIDNLTNGLTNVSLRSAGANVEMRHAGPAVFGANAGPTNASVALEVQSTTRAFLLPRMTTAQRDALTAVNGMVVYNTTANQVQARVNGAWVAL